MNVANTYHKGSMGAYRGVFEQFADDAAFLWVLRSIAIEQPHYSRIDIQQLEQRLEAQLNGLMTAIEESWPICLEALEFHEPGEAFSAAVLAFRSHDAKKIQTAVEAGLANAETVKGFVSALGWLPSKLVQGWIDKFLGSKDLNHKYLAIGACSVRREDPGDALNRILQREDCRQHAKLYGRTLRLIGELRRLDLMPFLDEPMQSEQEDISFWASRSAILLGNRAAVANLESYVFATGPMQQRAIDIAFRALPVAEGRQWIARLAEDELQTRAVIKATGALGDPHAVNWLLLRMEDVGLSRLAAEAFTNITGIDFEQNQLIDDKPVAPAQDPDDDSNDEAVALDEDENLAWPDIEKVKTIWMNHGRNFIAGQRYFMGRNITVDLLKDKLLNAYQRQRHAAALELALVDSGMPLQNARARVMS